MSDQIRAVAEKRLTFCKKENVLFNARGPSILRVLKTQQNIRSGRARENKSTGSLQWGSVLEVTDSWGGADVKHLERKRLKWREQLWVEGERAQSQSPDDPPLLLRRRPCCPEGFSVRFSRTQRGESRSGSARTPSWSAPAALPGRHLQDRPRPPPSRSPSWPGEPHLRLSHQLLWSVQWGRGSHICMPGVLHWCCCWGRGWQACFWEHEDGDRASPSRYSCRAQQQEPPKV